MGRYAYCLHRTEAIPTLPEKGLLSPDKPPFKPY
jgi:hypothetical protein